MRVLKNKKWLQIVIILCILSLLSGCKWTANSNLSASQGVLDLTDWNFDQNGIIRLHGEWDFYWGELLTPDDFANNTERLPDWIRLPGSWNDHTRNGQKIGSFGYATYRLIVQKPKSEKHLALNIKAMSTAYNLWVDGELLATNGVVGTSEDTMQPQYLTKRVFFTPQTESIEIVVQVANFKHRRGGMWESIELGTANQIIEKSERLTGLQMLLLGSLMIMGLYQIGLFAIRKRDSAPLYFGIFCLLIGTRSFMVGEASFYKIFPNINWEVALKLEYISAYIGLPIFVKYVHKLYPKICSVKITTLSLVLGVISCSIVLLTSSKFYTQYLNIYQAVIFITIFYLIYVLILAILYKEKGSILISFGVIFYALTVINDILYYNEWIPSADLNIFGLFVFVFTHSFILSIKFSKSFSDVENRSGQLQEVNISLEEKVRERTQALEEFNRHLSRANIELFRMEESRRHLLSNISHDLRTPMTSIQGYIEAFLDDVVVDPEEQRKYMQLIHTKTLGLNRLIHDLYQLSQLEARQITFTFEYIDVRELVADIAQKYETDIENAELQFQLHSLAPEENCMIYVDPGRLDQVFSNLIFNAIHFTPKGGRITLSCVRNKNESMEEVIIIKVKDTGAGIEKEKLPYVFDRFYKVSGTRNTSAGGSGLGLAIAKEIVLSHAGQIWVESTPESGSTFCCSFKIVKPFQQVK